MSPTVVHRNHLYGVPNVIGRLVTSGEIAHRCVGDHGDHRGCRVQWEVDELVRVVLEAGLNEKDK